MDKNKFEIIRLRMERTAEALRKNNMYCECADSSEEALEIIQELINEDDTVAVGGSMTLFETGVISGGMIPKVNCCIEAIHKGVDKVIIMDGRVPHSILMELLTNEGAGTMFTGEISNE